MGAEIRATVIGERGPHHREGARQLAVADFWVILVGRVEWAQARVAGGQEVGAVSAQLHGIGLARGRTTCVTGESVPVTHDRHTSQYPVEVGGRILPHPLSIAADKR